MSTSQAGDTHRRPVLDALLLAVGTLLAIVAAVVLVAQYRPVLFRHDTAFIGLSLAILAGFAALVGFRVGRWAAERDEPRLLRTALLVGAVVIGFAATASVAAVGWYRLRDGVGWPRVELGVLVVLVGGFAFVAVLVGGWTHRWWQPLALSVGAGLCLGALVAAAVASWALDNDFSDRKADQCVARGTVTYCHYPGYELFVDDWAPVVDAVLAGAPVEVAQRPLMVQQGTKTGQVECRGNPAGRRGCRATARVESRKYRTVRPRDRHGQLGDGSGTRSRAGSESADRRRRGWSRGRDLLARRAGDRSHSPRVRAPLLRLVRRRGERK